MEKSINISFDLKDFNNDKSEALRFIKNLKRLKKFNRTNDIDKFFSQQPSYAYKYVKQVLTETEFNWQKNCWEYKNVEKSWLSVENEKVFVKNLKFAIAYLEITNQKGFRDKKLQQRFENKLYKNAGACYDYANKILKGRIPQDKEVIFLKEPVALYFYSKNIIKGKLPDSIHNKVSLLSFDNEYFQKRSWCYQYIKDYLAQDFNRKGDWTYYRY